MLPVVYELDKPREFKLSFNVIARLEKILGLNITKLDTKNLSLSQVANILAEANRKEDPSITPEKIGDLIDEHSNMTDAFIAVFKCINEAFGTGEQQAGEAQPAETPESGTGKLSTEAVSEQV